MSSWLHLILGIKPSADSAEVRSAYAGLLKRFHPDLCVETETNRNRLELIRMAYQVYSDPKLRQEHTRSGEIPNGIDVPEKLAPRLKEAGIKNLAKGFLAGFQKNRPTRGRDLVQKVHLSVGELLKGTTRIFDVARQNICGSCAGSGSAPTPPPEHCHVCDGTGTIGWRKIRSVGIECPFCEGLGIIIVSPCSPCDGLGSVKTQTPFRVTFPSGTPEGHRTIVTGEGEKGLAGGRHGDLIFVACLDPSSGFQRAGMDLLMDVEFNHQKTNIHIDHPEGPVEVTVPNDGAVDVIIVKGYGLPSVQDSQTRGDIRVQLKQKTDS